MGNINYRLLPTELTSLNRSPKRFAPMITSAILTPVPNLVQMCPRAGLVGRWVKYNHFYLCHFGGTQTLRHTDGFSSLKAQATRSPARIWQYQLNPKRHILARIWGLIDSATYFGRSNYLKTILGSWIGVLKPNAPNIETFILSKLLDG